MKKQIYKLFLFLVLITVPLSIAKAADLRTNNSIYVSKGEIVSGNMYAVGNSIAVDGNISGDLIAAAQTITVNGRVEGDIIAVGQDIIINGEVGGNIRIIGGSLTINGPVARNVNTFGNKVSLGDKSNVGWDVYIAASNAEVRGSIDGNLNGNIGRALIAGKIGKNVDLTLNNQTDNQDLIIASEASINGDLLYTAKNAATISDKANVAGKTQQRTLEVKNSNTFFMSWLWEILFTIFSALVVGLVIIYLGKNSTPKILDKIQEIKFKALMLGLIMLIIMPIIAIILAFSLIGLPLSLITLVSWLILIYLAKIISAIFVGRFILNKITKTDDWKLIWALILGVVVCWLLFSMPLIGYLLQLLSICFGLGGIWAIFSPSLKNEELKN